MARPIFHLRRRSADSAAAASESAGSAPAVLPGADEILDLKPLGQVSSSFIVAVNGEGLWIVDQHVAHERILFEQHLRARREGALGGQRMLAPLIVELNPRQLATFEQIADELRANGFEAELMGARTVAIQAAPAGISSADAEKLLFEILDGIARENQAISIDSLQSKIAASTACHAAIKVNTPLDHTKMEWLLSGACEDGVPDELPARAAGGAAVFGARNRAGVQTDLSQSQRSGARSIESRREERSLVVSLLGMTSH